MKLPRFYPIVDTAAIRARRDDPVTVARILLDCSVQMLQFRHKDEWTQLEYDQAEEIAALSRSAGATFILNDRADFAHLLNCGLHVGQDDLPVRAARVVMGADAVIGLSTHNRRQLTDASEQDIAYAAIGPIFETGSKLKPDPVLGVEKLRTLVCSAAHPLVAIGGITLQNAAEVLNTGVGCVATISGYLPESLSTESLTARVREWMQLSA